MDRDLVEQMKDLMDEHALERISAVKYVSNDAWETTTVRFPSMVEDIPEDGLVVEVEKGSL